MRSSVKQASNLFEQFKLNVIIESKKAKPLDPEALKEVKHSTSTLNSRKTTIVSSMRSSKKNSPR